MIEPTERLGAINSSGTSSGLNLAGVIQGSFSLTGRRVTITSPFSNSWGLFLGDVVTVAADPTTGCKSFRLTTEELEPRSEFVLLASRLFLRRVSTSTLCESVTWGIINIWRWKRQNNLKVIIHSLDITWCGMSVISHISTQLTCTTSTYCGRVIQIQPCQYLLTVCQS